MTPVGLLCCTVLYMYVGVSHTVCDDKSVAENILTMFVCECLNMRLLMCVRVLYMYSDGYGAAAGTSQATPTTDEIGGGVFADGFSDMEGEDVIGDLETEVMKTVATVHTRTRQ